MSSNSKRKETITPSVLSAKKNLSRHICYNKNKKLKWKQEHAEKTCELEESIAPVTSLDLIFDPSRHRTQCGTHRLCTSDKIHYLKKEWRNFITLVTTNIINCVSESNEKAEPRISNSSSITDKDKLIWYPSHRSESFWKNFIEYFGVFTLNNFLPYTSSNSASSHNIEHLECVNKLIHGLEQLSNSINQFLQKYYESLYKNLNKLNWGPFTPRQFRVFLIAVINFNMISDYHWDEHNDPNSFCCLVALGEFEGDLTQAQLGLKAEDLLLE
ncbi:hypothetical protein C1646_670545 [Rhizophagus diaphanus]|nr:hypothetical protein C1646_670545 [Rhizophagus diaphanus] [Rhizophagus sp. MUCL 43196]